MTLLDGLRGRLAAVRGPTPFRDAAADERRRWAAAREVSDGVASALLTAAFLRKPRRCHALYEGAVDAADAVDATGGR